MNSPKVAVKSEIFNPPANIDGSGLPKASIESKAMIKPITDPKNPNTKPNRLESIVRRSILLAVAEDFFTLMRPLTTKKIDAKRHKRMSDIKSGPPSTKILSVMTWLIIPVDVNVNVFMYLKLVKHAQT